jgi:hypothetical protein
MNKNTKYINKNEIIIDYLRSYYMFDGKRVFRYEVYECDKGVIEKMINSGTLVPQAPEITENGADSE